MISPRPTLMSNHYTNHPGYFLKFHIFSSSKFIYLLNLKNFVVICVTAFGHFLQIHIIMGLNELCWQSTIICNWIVGEWRQIIFVSGPCNRFLVRCGEFYDDIVLVRGDHHELGLLVLLIKALVVLDRVKLVRVQT